MPPRRPRGSSRLLGGWALALLTAACGVDLEQARPRAAETSTSTTEAAPTTTEAAPQEPSFGPLEWEACGGGLDCATLQVPLDWDDPQGEPIELALARQPAGDRDGRIGSLLVNPGGPGGSGVEFVRFFRFGTEIDDRFDLVSWDPRGVGDSTAIGCGDTVEQFRSQDPDPDDAAEQRALDDAARAVAEECAAEDGDLLPHVGTEDVARDLEAIRQALGEGQISYAGFSYGTLIGLRYLELFPDGARAVVLDGVADPAHDLTAFLRAQTVGFEQAAASLFASCGDDGACPVDDPAAAYDQIAATVETSTLPAGGGDRLGPAELATAAIFATYDDTTWPVFHQALADALDGDGSSLYAFAEAYEGLTRFTPYVAVECVDSRPPQGAAAYQAFAAELEAISPRFGRAIANELLPCAYWPAAPSGDPADVVAPGAPPVLVIGNTGDAATPYPQAVKVADDLATGHLLTFDGEGHTSVGESACVDEIVTEFLVDLTLPPEGTTC